MYTVKYTGGVYSVCTMYKVCAVSACHVYVYIHTHSTVSLQNTQELRHSGLHIKAQ